MLRSPHYSRVQYKETLLQKRNMHISRIISFLKIGLFLLMLHLITIPGISAKEEENKRGYKGTITKERLIEHFENKEGVEGYVIEGSDIIDIIKDPNYQDYHIEIENSVIKGGLDFSSITKTHIDSITLPEEWDEKYRKEFRQKNSGKEYRVVKNPITIVNSNIEHFLFRPKNQWMYGLMTSVKAKSTFFNNGINFRFATFTGYADFVSATFTEYADFNSATFTGYAKFDSATFTGGANFYSATFTGDAYFYWTIFRNLAYFHKTIFNTLIFDSVTFEKYADLRDTNIEKFNFQNISPTVIHGRAVFKLKNGNRKQRFCLSYLNFTKLLLSWKQLPDYDIWVSNIGEERIKSFVDIKNEKKNFVHLIK